MLFGRDLPLCMFALLSAFTPVKAAEIKFGCKANHTAETSHQGLLINNTWNSRAAGNFHWLQCLLQRRGLSGFEYGWAWRWPQPGKAVYAYPELLMGTSPWTGASGGDSVFPRRFSLGMSPINVSYDVSIATNGSYNLAAEMWLTKRTPIPGRPSVDTIGTEVMIWSDYSDDMIEGMGNIEKARDVSTSGRLWSVFTKKDWSDASQANGQRWTYVAYVAKDKTRAIHYDLTKFLAHAVSRGWVKCDDFIASFELGMELVSGTGHAWVRQFRVKPN